MLLTAALTFEAVTAERAHQAAVRRAIRDDASVVADDLLHRTVYEFEVFASRPLRLVISNHLREYNTLPSAAELADDDRLSDVAFVVDRLFLIDVSHNTVKTHSRMLYRKLAVTTREEAVQVARRRGLL